MSIRIPNTMPGVTVKFKGGHDYYRLPVAAWDPGGLPMVVTPQGLATIDPGDRKTWQSAIPRSGDWNGYPISQVTVEWPRGADDEYVVPN